MQSIYANTLEQKCEFELPCLAQSKIEKKKHAELIDNYFLGNIEDYTEQGITFGRNDFDSYEAAVSKFKPSTLKVYLTSMPQFFPMWLNEEILEIIESYLGFKPYLFEAYLRRNFHADYKVMNHFWHRDINHRDYIVKVFFFFSDCELENGPHEYISGTIADQRLSGKMYYSDDEVDELYPESSTHRVRSIVKAGTVVIEDTRGLHRAVVPKQGHRDLGFAVFLPKSIFSKKSAPCYNIGSEAFRGLSKKQRSYVPRNSIG